MTSRGIRNHNPGNIRKSSEKWQGLAERQPDSEFATFIAPEWGIRALARVLITYQDKHHLTTLSQILTRYAPAVENNLSAYVDHVSKLTTFRPSARLDLHTYADLRPLVEAIIRHENGEQPYDSALIDRGLELAGVPRPLKPANKTRTVQGAKVAVGSTIIGGAGSDVLQQISESTGALDGVAEFIPWVRYISIAVTLLGIGLMLYAWWEGRKVKENDLG